MRRIAIGTVVLSFALVSMAWAGAKDKSSNTVVDINATGTLNNATAITKIASSKPCALQVQMQTLSGVADGDIIVCVADADLLLPAGGNGVVLTGAIKAGKLNFKADLSEVDIFGTGCGDVEAISYNGGIRCFKDDGAYRLDAGVGSWRDDCAALGGFLSGAPGATKLNAPNDTQSVVVGICQTLTVGARLTGPTTTEFARTGQRTPIVP